MNDIQTIKKLLPEMFDRELVEEVMKIGDVRNFAAGQLIMDYGQYIRSIPLLLKGSIKVLREDETGREIFLYYLRPGEVCAMSLNCCMANRKSQVKAIAEDDSLIMAIPVEKMDEWFTSFPAWKKFVMASYSVRFEELLATVEAIAFKKMDERLMDYLTKKAKAVSSSTLFVTHQEIANELNASREAISRLLKHLEKEGEVTLGRNRIDLKVPV